ncbi:MAG: DivIVA domain-containing protein [Arthrobacter sp.]
MSFFLVFLAVLLIGAVLWASVGGSAGKKGRRPLPALLDAGIEEPPANLPPVLLPANAAPEDVDSVRFALGLRGYRMDQVDQVLDELRDQLAASRHEVETLRVRLAALEQPAPAAADGSAEVSAAPGPDTLKHQAEETPVPGPQEPAPGEDRA